MTILQYIQLEQINTKHCLRLAQFLKGTWLQNKYICPRCICRKLMVLSNNIIYLTNENNIVSELNSIFKAINEESIDVLNVHDHTKSNCILCLGILQDRFVSLFVEKVKETLKTSGYDYGGMIDENMQTNMSLPSALFIREYKFWQRFYKKQDIKNATALEPHNSFKSYSSERDKMFIGIKFI